MKKRKKYKYKIERTFQVFNTIQDGFFNEVFWSPSNFPSFGKDERRTFV